MLGGSIFILLIQFHRIDKSVRNYNIRKTVTIRELYRSLDECRITFSCDDGDSDTGEEKYVKKTLYSR